MLPKKYLKYKPIEFAKGKRGIIYIFKKNNKTFAIKVKNPKSEALERINNEANFLKVLNKHKIGPRLIDYGEGYICYEFVDGITIKEYLKKNKLNDKLILDIENQCRILDSLKINKEEMHKPFKNIIIYKNAATLIDFERCHYTSRPKNLNQFKEFLRRINS